MSRPRIAVTTSQRSGWRVYPLIKFNLWLVGGHAERWGAGRPADLDKVDGLIIGGGDDISPDLYGGQLGISARLDPARDALERHLAQEAYARNIPVLGICRGSQMLNVALGGTLDQDAFASFPDAKFIKTILPKRTVCVDAGSTLDRVCGTQPMKVNALHTQAVDKLGDGLRVAARDEAGMIQAIERNRDPFCLGVQWHPEHLFYAHRQRAIFRALVVAAKARAEACAQSPAVNEDAAAQT
ncbi:gamma-glutamyl-gamma-aminobutyrate hydrolase family protein [Tropicibacter naphthalenivorans]|uniref:Putative glutamine amidotransferasec n=1 Tax=Tropicibacter naphthalenivorans TaxID=441103 RepID=A0A0P1G1W8_9RHOB|nr:type 1 glutamine amidotransferase [Tropicibacter naphthalenivorans]CUH75650.1 Putative glutamine amidotransferasec [Tropicibacter naphthalenivorans]SMC43018.1 putative glutamine amidotransferase [Tropicibacter naphthalenivorans]